MGTNTLAMRRPWVAAWTVGAAILTMAVVLVAAAGAHPHKRHMIRIESEGAFLGVTMQELTEELRKGLNSKAKNGVLVSSVVEGSAAERAGIEEGDIIVEFDGNKVESPDALRELIAEKEVKDEVSVKFVREGKSKTIDLTLGDWADHSPMAIFGDADRFEIALPRGEQFSSMIAHLRPRQLGVRAHEMDADLSSYFGVDEGEGVLVLGVEGETTAEQAGIKAGDVIVALEDKKVETIGDIREAMSALEKGDELNITVVRKNKRVKLKGEVQDAKNVWIDQFPREMRRHGRGMHKLYLGVEDDLREQMKELRKELDELKKEFNKS